MVPGTFIIMRTSIAHGDKTPITHPMPSANSYNHKVAHPNMSKQNVAASVYSTTDSECSMYKEAAIKSKSSVLSKLADSKFQSRKR